MHLRPHQLVDGPLTVLTTHDPDGVVVVALAGELDRANVATAEEALDRVALVEHPRVVIDLTQLEFIYSSGIALLVSVRALGDGRGSLRILPSPAPEVKRILDI